MFPGGKWYTGTIKNILENPLCKGIAHYKENNIKNKDLALEEITGRTKSRQTKLSLINN